MNFIGKFRMNRANRYFQQQPADSNNMNRGSEVSDVGYRGRCRMT